MDVEAQNEPEPDWEKDADYIIAMATTSGGGVYKASELESNMIQLYIDASKELKDLESYRKVLKAKLLRAAGDADQILGHGFMVSCKAVKASAGTVITEDMVGETIGERAGYRGFTATKSSK